MNPDSKRDYYVARFGLWRVGPLSFDDVAHEIKLGSLDKRSRIYSSHLEDWTRIQEVPEFSVFLQNLPPSLFLRSSMKLSHAAKDLLSFFSPQWKSWTVFVFLTFSIAFIPFDIPIHPDWYNDTVYFIKNPDSRGFGRSTPIPPTKCHKRLRAILSYEYAQFVQRHFCGIRFS